MKIIFPIGSFYPSQSGGPNNTIFWLSKSLKKNNFKTTVVTTDKDITNKEIIFDQFINNDVGKIIYCKEYYYRFPIKLIKNSIKVMDKSDIIHLTSLFYVPSLILAYFAKKKNKKIVWSVRGELEENALNFNILLKKIYLKIIKNILNKNFIFHSTSYNETKNINKYFKNSKVIQIPNYIEMPKKQNKNKKE